MGLFSGLAKTFRSITKSTIGRTLLTAGAVYAGGAAFGFWESPFPSLNNVFARSTGALAGESAGVASDVTTASPAAQAMSMGAQESAASALLAPGASYDRMYAANDTGTMGAQVGVEDPPQWSQETPQGMAQPQEIIQPPAGLVYNAQDTEDRDMGEYRRTSSMMAQASPQNGPFSQALEKVFDFYKGDFAKAALTTQIGGAVKGAFTPTPEEIAKAQYDARRNYELQRAADQNANFNVGRVNLGMRPPGLINRAQV